MLNYFQHQIADALGYLGFQHNTSITGPRGDLPVHRNPINQDNLQSAHEAKPVDGSSNAQQNRFLYLGYR